MAEEKNFGVAVNVTEHDSEPSSTSSTEIPLPAQWPSKPQPLVNSKWQETALDLYDFALCVLPIALMVEAALCIVADRRDSGWTGFWVGAVSNLTTQLIRFNAQLTTAFTIVFVLIFATFLRRYALYRAQFGETVARLEQFQASGSLPSTLKAILSLRAFNSLSLALVVIWSFYYIGSQASQNEYAYRTALPYNNGKFNVAFQSPTAPSLLEPSQYTNDVFAWQTVAKLFSQFALSDTSTQGFDLLGAMKMPWIDWSLTGWQDTRLRQDYLYTSYAGLPLIPQAQFDPKQTGNISDLLGDFQLKTMFLDMNCNKPSLGNISNYPTGVPEGTNYTIVMTDDVAGSNPPLKNFEIWDRWDNVAVMTDCAIWTQPVEVKGSCNGNACQISWAQALPYSTELEVFYHPELVDNFLSTLVAAETFWLQYYTNWVNVQSYVENGGSLYYNIITVDSFTEQDWPSYLTWRMMSNFNTWYFCSQQYLNPLNWNPYEISYQGMYDIISGQNTTQNLFETTTFKGSLYLPRYSLSIVWLVMDLISNMILVVAAIASFWLRKHTLAPDIFGYVSSLTRDNPNICLPPGGTGLSGLDRARLLRDVRVRIADVGAADGAGGVVGHVTVLHADAPPVAAVALARDRSYV